MTALRVAGPLDFTGVKMSWRGPSLRDGTVMLLEHGAHGVRNLGPTGNTTP